MPLLKGAKRSKGCVVIIDVLRAFSVEAYCFNKGILYSIPCSTKEECFKYNELYPNSILIGERHGIKLEGFDCGNSPSEIQNIDMNNKILIHTTSSGTQGVYNAKNADVVIAGSLLNAKAIATYIKSYNYKRVSLVPMGKEGIKNTKEDIICAKYIKALLLNKKYDVYKHYDEIKNDDGLKFFKNDPSFPQSDFDLCIKTDVFNFVLVLDKIDNINVFHKVDL